MVWKEYSMKHMEKKLHESMDRCTDRRYIARNKIENDV